MPRKGSAKADTVEVQTAQSHGDVAIYDPYGQAGPPGLHVYDVSDHTANVHPKHLQLVADATAGEPYESEAGEVQAPPPPLADPGEATS